MTGSVTRKVRTICDIFRSAGAGGVLRYICRRIYSNVSYLLLEMTLVDSVECRVLPTERFIFREASADDVEALAKAFPSELGLPQGSDLLRKELHKRFDTGIPCFTVWEGSSLLGALWCGPWEWDSLLPCELRGRDAFDIRSLFTVPQARGKGVAKDLLRFALRQMAECGKVVAYSRIYPSRQVSIVAHERVGFRRIGILTTSVRFGLSRGRYTPIGLDKRPN